MTERIKLTIRIPAKLHNQVQQVAQQYNMSQNVLICCILAQYFKDLEDKWNE